jgi:hypothetical protein
MIYDPFNDPFGDDPTVDDYDETDDPFADARRRPGEKKRKPPGVSLTEKLPPLLREAGKPKPFSVFDLETYHWVHPYLVGHYDGRTFTHFVSRHWTKGGRSRGRAPKEKEVKKAKRRPPVGLDCVEQFLEWYLTPGNLGQICYAHNGGNFDNLFLLRRLLKGDRFQRAGFRTQLIAIQSNLFRLVVTHPDVQGRWTFSDSARLLPMSLNKVGETFSVGRKVELHRELRCSPEKVYDVLAKPQHEALAVKYLRQDCVVLYKGLTAFSDVVDTLGGKVRATAPSTSLDIFRRSHQHRDLYLNRHLPSCPDLGKPQVTCTGCGHAYARRAFYGGRTEIFTGAFDGRRSGERLRYYDFNSMYASVMRLPMPIGQAIEIQVGGTPASIERMASDTLVGFIDCEVEIPRETYLPPLPVRAGGKLLFPSGRFRGVWDTSELALLKEVGGRITKVLRQVWYPAEPFFADFVAALWRYRRKCAACPTEGTCKRCGWNAGLDAVAKLMVNSNFGKWGQREEQTETWIDPPRSMILSHELRDMEMELGVWQGQSRRRPQHVAPQISAHVTALARVELYRAAQRVLKEGGRLYYSDTDSVICSGVDWPDSKELGGLKLEHVIQRAQFVLPKSYYIECAPECPCRAAAEKKGKKWQQKTIKTKGVGRGLGEDVTWEDWLQLTAFHLPLEQRQVVRRRLAKWRESMRYWWKRGSEFPRTLTQRKGFGSEYDKREVLPDGVNTLPLILDADALTLRYPSRAGQGFAKVPARARKANV